MPKKPSTELLTSIYRRLLVSDPTAPAELAEVVIAPLVDVISRATACSDEALAFDAVTDAVLEFSKRPQAYSSEKSQIWSFLELASRRNLANLSLKENRQRARLSRFASVAFRDSAGKKVKDGILTTLVEGEANAGFRAAIAVQAASWTPQERAVLRLIADGVRATAEYAAALGIADETLAEQRRLVKRVKDRLLRRLRRSKGNRDDG